MKPFILFFLITGCLLLSCKNKSEQKEEKEIEANTLSNPESSEDKSEATKTILFFGNSLTAGLGLDPSESFPSLIQDRIDSLGMDYEVVNAGLSGETSSNGAGRIDWVLQQKVDVFVLELGANDMLRGLELNATKESLKEILTTVKTKYPEAQLLICEMQAPPNMGPEYVKGFSQIFSDLSKEFNAGFIPFFLDGVAGVPGLTLDGKHPTAEGQKIVRDNIWRVLEDYL